MYKSVTKRQTGFAGLFLAGILFFVCGEEGIFAQQAQSLDGVIAQAGKDVGLRFSAETKLAVLNFTSTGEAFSDYVIEELSGVLVMNPQITVIERRSLDLIRKEMNLQLSGEVSDDSAQAIGKQLGAQAIVTGSLTNMGNVYRFRVKVINVETARIEAQFSYNLGSDQQVTFLLQGSQNAPQTSQSAAAAAQPKTYKIGDKGPAGGIIFYDKGKETDGWRYLEAAPNTTEWGNPRWDGGVDGLMDGLYRQIGDGLGAGKRNTRFIVNQVEARNLQQAKKYTSSAAQLCNDLEAGGYDDWYLPSGEELKLMYKNLWDEGLGGFLSAEYWSSSNWNNGSSVTFLRFQNGRVDGDYGWVSNKRVRAVRQF